MAREMALGGVRLVAIEDGHFTPEATYLFPKWDWDRVDREEAGADAGGRIRVPIGCFLFEGPAGLVLIDSGGGPDELSPPPFTTGRLPAELARLGVAPADVTGIVHTHLHFDHFWGDLDPVGGAAFPNATIVLHADELGWGRGQERAARWLPLVDEGRVRTVDGPSEVFPGISAVETRGHTPGHLSFEVGGSGAAALVLGDVTHHPVQLDYPGWGARFDADPDRADATRAAMFERLAAGDEVLAANHWPSWGRVVVDQGRRRFVPV